MKQALEDLPENFRLPVLLADVEGFSYQEIAEMLDIPIGTVMSRLHRGRKAMQKALFEYADARLAGLRRARTGGTPRNRRADCNETLRELEAFLDGELSDEDAGRAIRAHLEGCPDCLQAFDFHAELKAVIATKCRRTSCRPACWHASSAASEDRRRRPHRLSAQSVTSTACSPPRSGTGGSASSFSPCPCWPCSGWSPAT